MGKASPLTRCLNTACGEPHEPGVGGAAKGLCARCYRYATRHDGELPGPVPELAGPKVSLQTEVPADLAERVREAAGPRGIASFIRRALEGALRGSRER